MLARRPNWEEGKNWCLPVFEKITAERTVRKLAVRLAAFAALHTGLAEVQQAIESLDVDLGIIAPALVVAAAAAVAVAVAAVAAAAAVVAAVAVVVAAVVVVVVVVVVVAAVIELVVLALAAAAVVVEAAAGL